MTNVGAEYLTTSAQGHLIVENFQIYLIVNLYSLKVRQETWHGPLNTSFENPLM